MTLLNSVDLVLLCLLVSSLRERVKFSVCVHMIGQEAVNPKTWTLHTRLQLSCSTEDLYSQTSFKVDTQD